MGWRGTTSTALNFGDNGECVGYLVGKPHHGLSYMFQMMNEARIGVGMGAVMLGYAGYLYSLEYARERPQGRWYNRLLCCNPVMLFAHRTPSSMELNYHNDFLVHWNYCMSVCNRCHRYR